MKFFQTVKQSLYSPGFYNSQKDASFGRPFRYFLKLVTVQALVMTIILGFVVVPIITKVLSRDGTNIIVSYYPADLELTLKGGQLSTNVTEPYVVPIPQEWASTDKDGSLPKNLAVIDTQASFTVDSFKSYDTFVLLTRDFVISTEKDGKMSIQELKGFPAGTFNRETLVGFVDTLRPLLKILIPLGFLAMFVGIFIVSTILNMLQLLIVALIVWVVSMVRKTGLTYGQAYRLGFYGITAYVIWGVFVLLVHIPSPWFIDLAITLFFMFINTKTIVRTDLPMVVPQP